MLRPLCVSVVELVVNGKELVMGFSTARTFSAIVCDDFSPLVLNPSIVVCPCPFSVFTTPLGLLLGVARLAVRPLWSGESGLAARANVFASLLHESIMLAITLGVNLKISSHIGTSGQCFRSTACAYFSFSQKPIVVYPQL